MTRCAQTGCPGTVRDDGFCDTCGMAPARPPEPATGYVPPAGARGGGDRNEGVHPPSPVTGAFVTGVVGGAVSIASMNTGSAWQIAPTSPAPSRVSRSRGPEPSRPTVPATAGSGRTGGTRGTDSTGAHRRGMLGAGLVEVPPVPARDPESAVLENPEVPEHRRFCSNCDDEVGRGRDGRPGRTEGFCRSCRHPFSFTPKLHKSDLIGGQYEVLGCLAHGGLGWIYLARDRNVSDRWVVLKGLLDTGATDSMAAAAAERAFLAEVEHPNIVKIYNFVRHEGSGYIVMEYVGGESLKDILLRHRKENGEDAALPLGQVIAYGLEVLRALGYLHNMGLLYCDFKPDNAIQSEEQLKLIDLGGVRRAFDTDSPIFGTPGYQAPEIADHGPSVSSDLYTVGRTLAVLSFPFKGYTTRHLRSLPPRKDVPLLMRHESYYRLLRRACHPDPARRFQSAAEMGAQLTGVLREVLSTDDGKPRPGPSALFGPEQASAGTEIMDALGGDGGTPVLAPLEPAEAAAALPVPLVYGTDPAAAFLAGLTARDPDDLAAALAAAPVDSPEVRLALIRSHIGLGELAEADRLLNEYEADHPEDWRIDWWRAVWELAGGDADAAVRIFDELYELMPGETAPKLGLGFCYEGRGDLKQAEHFYELVWRTDPTFVSAAFGLARARLAADDRQGAIRELDGVARISTHYVSAQLGAVAAAVRGRRPDELSAEILGAAARRLHTLRLDTERYARFAAEVLEAALAWQRAGGRWTGKTPGDLLGVPLREPSMRRRLEETYRLLARLASDPGERHTLVLRANAVRPRTFF
ncbi:serine/threonine-protein kinase [Actinomadura kijaniata]|uniref:serine/threonine-protein kinase n=1 Tax=Actinomadura kijaniata TaxID=46161 RepID=UPI0009FF3838|nr:serine/threonine-protein kinase [Actinomadura kijaniata]